MYYLLVNTNCKCYKYGARLWQIACFWVVLKEIFFGGGSPPNPYAALPARKYLLHIWQSYLASVPLTHGFISSRPLYIACSCLLSLVLWPWIFIYAVTNLYPRVWIGLRNKGRQGSNFYRECFWDMFNSNLKRDFYRDKEVVEGLL